MFAVLSQKLLGYDSMIVGILGEPELLKNRVKMQDRHPVSPLTCGGRGD